LGPGDVVEGEYAPSLLGRLCTNPEEPLASFTITNPKPFYTGPPSVIALSDVSAVLNEVRTGSVETRLGEIFQSLLTSGNQNGFAISTQTIRTFKLIQQEKTLKMMWKDPEARKEIKAEMGKWPDRRKLYMIVGFKTCINATVTYLQQNQLSAKISVSITEALRLLTAASLPIPSWLNAMIKAGFNTEEALITTGKLYGEVIFAIRYREVSRRSKIAEIILRGGLVISRTPVPIPGGNMVFAPSEKSAMVDGKQSTMFSIDSLRKLETNEPSEPLDIEKWEGLADDDILEDDDEENNDLCIVPYTDEPALELKRGGFEVEL
jgi:hypothetical protein